MSGLKLNRHVAVAVFFVLALCSPSRADEDVYFSNEYISPYGDYIELQLRNAFRVGESGTATGTATFYGNATIDKGDLLVRGHASLGNGTLRTYGDASFNANTGGYRVGINNGGNLPRVECEVVGDIFAGMYRASPGKRCSTCSLDPTYDQDSLLHFGPSLSGTVIYMGAYCGPDSAITTPMWTNNPPSNANGGWNDPRSACRIYGSPMIVLNGRDDNDNPGGTGALTDYKMQYSGGNVGIGTTTPGYMLTIATGKFAIGYAWNAFSSRDYKKDIMPLSAAEIGAVGAKIAGLNVVRYHYKEDKPEDALRVGVIAEEAPKEMLTADGKGLHSAGTLGFLIAGVRTLDEENRRLEARIAALESKLAREGRRS